jgi:hypothetical protein
MEPIGELMREPEYPGHGDDHLSEVLRLPLLGIGKLMRDILVTPSTR